MTTVNSDWLVAIDDDCTFFLAHFDLLYVNQLTAVQTLLAWDWIHKNFPSAKTTDADWISDKVDRLPIRVTFCH
jgi:hypothetical protein